MSKILGVSKDLNLLRTRELMLTQLGHDTTSVLGLERALPLITERKFDLVIFGHSLSLQEKAALMDHVRAFLGCPVLDLVAPGTPICEGTISIEPFNPELFIETVQRLLGAN